MNTNKSEVALKTLYLLSNAQQTGLGDSLLEEGAFGA